MPLERYREKRKFERTPEPPGKETAEAGRVFCVQRHDASRLHYDLRLEVGGTLKSWAVPKGPSLDPGVKQLAVLVEDHPIEYAAWEGNIPKGNYGAGSMMLWDAGHFEVLTEAPAETQLARGDFKFRLHGEKLRGEFALVRMKDRKTGADSKDWLLIKKKDTFARPGYDIERDAWSVQTGRTQHEIEQDLPPLPEAPMPSKIEPMLAQIAHEAPRGDGWTFEIKWDGVRAMAFASGDLRFTGRKGNDISVQYPELAGLRPQIGARTAILDGEIAVLDEKGRPSFGRIQPRIMASGASAIAQLARSRPAVFFAFDLLYLDGRDLRGLPLAERKRRLRAIVTESALLRFSENFDDGHALLEAAKRQGLEGIVAKRATSMYESRRSPDWVKVKSVTEQEFVICGFTRGERDYFGALLLGVYADGKLRFAGNVGTGFDNALMKHIHEMLRPLVTPDSPFAEIVKLPQPITWVKPKLVATVRFLEWTEEGRLRAPVFAGLRMDVEPTECVRDDDVGEQAARELIPEGPSQTTVALEGRQFLIRNLNKIFYPEQKYTKRDVVNYYDAVAEWLLPHWRDRPLSLRRYPDGIAKEGFFQKNAEGLPDWIRTAVIRDGDDNAVRVVGDSRAQLVYLAQLGCIDQNPWMSRIGTLDHPDLLLVDLDPQECSYDLVIEAAHVVRKKLEALGLAGYAKTTGGDGMHIYVPLEPIYSFDQTKSFAEILARLCAAERSDIFTTPRAVSKRRKDRVYFDYLQNGRGKTISAPYVLRAYDGAPVATPLDWTEVKPGLTPRQFHLRNALERFRGTGDLFAGVLEHRQRLEPALEKLAGLLADLPRRIRFND
jgi:bifunctional non-homologous end joining protein LigD